MGAWQGVGMGMVRVNKSSEQCPKQIEIKTGSMVKKVENNEVANGGEQQAATQIRTVRETTAGGWVYLEWQREWETAVGRPGGARIPINNGWV